MYLKVNKLYENVFSLVSLKGLEYLLNFIIFPYLLRVLGAEIFGMVALMQSFIQYFIILVDYGFNMTGPRDIARESEKNKIAEKFINIMASKFLIFVFITIIAFIGVILFSYYKAFNVVLFWVVYISVLGNIIFPIWFFQGIQQMRYITIVNVLARFIALILIFIFVRDKNDYILAALFQSSITVLAGIFSFIILIKKYRYIFLFPKWCNVKLEIINGWHIFLSTIAINIYTSTNIVILGILTSNTIVGYFSAANKLIDSIKGLMTAITQAVYPYISNLLRKSEKETLMFIKRFTKLYCGSFFVSSILLIFLSENIINILFGKEYVNSVIILQMMSILPFIISISNIYGIQIMINWGYQKEFSKILIKAAIFDFILIWPSINILGSVGLVLTVILVEILVTILTVYYVKKYIV